MRTVATSLFTLAMLGASGAMAQSFSLNANPAGTAGPITRGVCGPTTLTQTTSQVPAALASISCNASGLHADNSYFRAYSLAAFPAGFTTCAVEVGIETADASGTGTTQPITINVYSNTGGAFPAGTRSVVGTATVQVADQTLTLLTVPLTATVPAGAELVLELFTPDGQVAGHSFFVGANAAGQSGPGFIQAASCGVTTPTNLAGIGFPDMHLILNAVGAGGGAGELTITPTAVDFGNQGVGSSSASSSVTLANVGTGSLSVSALTAAAAPFALAGGTCGNVPIALAAGASCTLNYQFTPAATGAASQNLTVTVDAPATGSGSIALSGTGVTGALTINPIAVDFGNQGVGSSSGTSTVVLQNTGLGSLNVSALTAAAAPFAQVGGSCGNAPFAIAGGASCSLDFQFTPAAAGAASQNLAVTVDAPATGSGSIALSGTGVSGTLAYSTTTLDFGAQNVGATVNRTLTLSNTGGAALSITAVTAPVAPFTLVGGTCGAAPITIAAGASCTLIYTYAPQSAVVSNQVLQLTTTAPGGGPVTLTGRGVAAIALPMNSTLAMLILLLGVAGVAGAALNRRS